MNAFYVNDVGNNVYLNIGNNEVLKVSYIFEDKNSVSYLATFLMMLKSVSIDK